MHKQRATISAARDFETCLRVSDESILDRPTPKIELVPINRLKKSPHNARTHSKKQIGQIVSSIRQFGWTYPLLTDESGNIVAGHGRLEAAVVLGLKVVPVISIANLNDVEKRALALADNQISANSGWDRRALAAELGELALLFPDCNLEMNITGFETAEIDALMGDLVDPDLDPVNEVTKNADTAVSIRGDLWQLGPHRLLCGDATASSDVLKVMGRNLATMVISDPPYNVRVSTIQGRGRIKHREFVEGSGEKTPKEFTTFLTSAFSLAAQYSVVGSIHFHFMDWRHLEEIHNAGQEVYSELKNVIVWMKSNAGQGTFYRSQHELIFAFKNGDAPHINNFELGQHGRNRSNVWSYAGVNTFRAARLDELTLHPTVKPVALVADAMRDCSRRGDIIFDPFMGSGTTILAAERVGRRGYGLDLDPLYVDAAVRRWQLYTKCDAVLKGRDRTFTEVARDRATPERRRGSR